MPETACDRRQCLQDLAGQGQPQPLDGVSLLPLIFENQQERPTPIAFETRGGWDTKMSRGSAKLALIDNRYKLLSDLEQNPEKDMLFDLLNDPGETSNLATRFPEITQKMRDDLVKWQQSCANSNDGNDYY